MEAEEDDDGEEEEEEERDEEEVVEDGEERRRTVVLLPLLLQLPLLPACDKSRGRRQRVKTMVESCSKKARRKKRCRQGGRERCECTAQRASFWIGLFTCRCEGVACEWVRRLLCMGVHMNESGSIADGPRRHVQ